MFDRGQVLKQSARSFPYEPTFYTVRTGRLIQGREHAGDPLTYGLSCRESSSGRNFFVSVAKLRAMTPVEPSAIG